MQPIDPKEVQRYLDEHRERDLYIHLEMTTGAYAAHLDQSRHPAATFLTNAVIRYSRGSISGKTPYRIGLKTAQGWVYSEGLTHWDEARRGDLILAGHDAAGKLVVSLQLSPNPF
ncbi:YojF family protein [Paenibacillus sp. CC-CFT747]|nr:YojF family protein [Paenibacillus sp. CC-CFT747]